MLRLSLPRRRESVIRALALPRRCAIAVLLIAQVSAGCSTSNFVVSEWRKPDYVAPEFKSVMVGGLIEQTSVRRNFEDEFQTQFMAAGVNALQSYRYTPADEKIDDPNLRQTARQAGADALLIVHPLRSEQKTEYGPSYYPVPSIGIFGSNVGAVWHGSYGAPGVTRYTEYTSEATLYDLTKDEVVWSGILRTTGREDVHTAVKQYVQAVIHALQQNKLLDAKKKAVPGHE
jgi:hypothetical protein